MTNDVTFQRAEYKDAVSRWALVDDACAGSEAVKEGDYLPRPNPLDRSDQANKRYEDYVKRALFYNATGRTLKGLTGTAFRINPVAELASSVDYMTTDIDGAGNSIYQQAKLTLKGTLKKGRHGLLVDYPQTGGQISKATMAADGVRATIATYAAESVVNWRTEKVGGIHRYVLIVLKESAENITADGFGVENVDQYRVLRLVDSVYSQEVWRKNDKAEWALSEEAFNPLNASGQSWNEIPFTFVGADNNDSSIDDAPLYDLAEVNIAHYRNSAEYEDTTFMCGQVQPVVSGIDESWVKMLQDEGFQIGSRTLFPLPEGASFDFVQADPNILPAAGMKHKEEQMVALGARLVTDPGVAKTATESNANNAKDTSVLSTAATNVSNAYAKCLTWAAMFMGSADESVFELNTDYVEHTLDAQMLTSLIGAWQSGQLPSSDLWAGLKKYGVIDTEKTDEEIKTELESESVNLGLDDGAE